MASPDQAELLRAIGPYPHVFALADYIRTLLRTVTTGSDPFVISANPILPVDYANGTLLELVGADGVNVRLTVDAFGTGLAARFQGRRARGTSAAPTAVGAADTLASFAGIGYGATGYSSVITCARILIVADETWTDTSQAAYLAFRSTPTGSVSAAEGMRLQGSGALTIGQTTDDAVNKLQVTGGTKTDKLAISGAVAGTFVANGATPVAVGNANVTANSVILFTLKTVGGTVGAQPTVKTITPTTGFTVAATAADTSTYNYVIIS